MRAFILTCLIATTLAAPQGYNYQQQQNSFSIGIPQSISSGAVSHQSSSIGSSSSSSSSSSHEGQSFLQSALQSPQIMQTLLSAGGGHQQTYAPQQSYYQRPQAASSASSQGFTSQPSIIPQSFGIAQQQPQQQFQQSGHYQQNYNRPAPVVTKDIYVHVAPEEPEEQHHQQQQQYAPPRKHYRIVFIKAPTPKIHSPAALRLQQAQNEEKTIIYVLTKKPDPLDLEQAFQDAAPKQPSKPEVYFIKYKTQEEAQHAQRTIQAQYDKLGGTTQISDEGVAPVTSVIGALDHGGSSSSSSTSGGFSNAGASGSSNIGGFSNAGPSTSYGAPLSAAGSSSGSSSSFSDNKYLPPIIRF